MRVVMFDVAEAPLHVPAVETEARRDAVRDAPNVRGVRQPIANRGGVRPIAKRPHNFSRPVRRRLARDGIHVDLLRIERRLPDGFA